MSFFLEFLRCILCCEVEDNVDRDDYDVSCRISTSYQSFFRRISDQTSENYRPFIPCRSTSSSVTSDIYRAPALHVNARNGDGGLLHVNTRSRNGDGGGNSSGGTRYTTSIVTSDSYGAPALHVSTRNGNGGGTSSTRNARSMERNHQLPQNSSQTTYSPRASSVPPNSSSSSSSSVKSLFFQPEIPSLSNQTKPLSKPKAAIVSPSSSSPTMPLLTSKSVVSPSKQSSPLSMSHSSSSSSLPKFRPTLSPASTSSTNQQAQASYIWVENVSLPIYKIPQDIEKKIKKDMVPDVLKRPLSPSTYADYFAALLYAEDYYIEKWSNFLLKKVPLELEKATVHKCGVKEDKVFVVFKIDAVPEKRPFLLSRDFVLAKPTGKQDETFKGVIHRVVKSTKVLVEFGDEFHSKHLKGKEYDVSFSFNRVCLKRAHQAVAAAADPSFQSLLFPAQICMPHASIPTPICHTNNKLNLDQMTTVKHILNHREPFPYLLEGSLRENDNKLSKAGVVIKEAVLGLYRHALGTRILVCGPVNNALDFMFRSLKSDIPKPEMFRVNAAFRDKSLVPEDILASCLYDDECFACPQLRELKQFRVVFTTFVSAFRLYIEGITAGHFSHIFLIDASTAPEPETMIPLANLANEKTCVIVMGEEGKRPSWVRSDIARKNGLSVSYFQRLRARHPCMVLDPSFMSKVNGKKEK